MASYKPKVALNYRDMHTLPSNERVGHQRMNPSRSKLHGLKGTTRDISPKGQTQERRRTHAGQPKCSGAVASYQGSVEAPGGISP